MASTVYTGHRHLTPTTAEEAEDLKRHRQLSPSHRSLIIAPSVEDDDAINMQTNQHKVMKSSLPTHKSPLPTTSTAQATITTASPHPSMTATTTATLSTAQQHPLLLSNNNNNNNNNNAGAPAGSAKKIYRSADNKWVTRDIAALDFLLGIPLAAEADIVRSGWRLQQQREHEDCDEDSSTGGSHVGGGEGRGEANKYPGNDAAVQLTSSKGTWWEKWINTAPATTTKSASDPAFRSDGGGKFANMDAEADQLERPTVADAQRVKNVQGVVLPAYAPGRRLEGDEAVRIKIPLTTDTITKQRSIARLATLREWEVQTAHGLNGKHPPLLNGRIFFSAAGSYPISIFSVVRYEPKKEEAAFRRKKLEAIGGGGSQFVMPSRDWRGISYRALLPRRHEKNTEKAFNRFLRKETREGGEAQDDSSSSSSSSSDSEDDAYGPKLLDDPAMVLGRHRNVMIGDRVSGPMVSSTIQFVEPALLKAELNKQFRERFDGWEPRKSARKYIGARVVQGDYVLMDPAEEYEDRALEKRNRQGSVTSIGSNSEGPKEKSIRMPPSLTLSKIRSLKRQALAAATRAKLEIGTLALACVYFERLCLDCRVDKSNRRLCFAACLLLAIKINEPNVGLVMRNDEDDGDDHVAARIQSWIRPNQRSNTMFASLLEFFTQEWTLSLKHLFNAEWGVFVALGFSLHANPSHVAFHFKRLIKTLGWNPLEYLGREMYDYWQEALELEDERLMERKRRREIKRKLKEDRLISLRIEIENEVLRRKKEAISSIDMEPPLEGVDPLANSLLEPAPKESMGSKRGGGIKLLHRFGLRRMVSHEKIEDEVGPASEHPVPSRRNSGFGMSTSPSMPTISTAISDSGMVTIDIPETNSETISIGSLKGVEKDGLIV